MKVLNNAGGDPTVPYSKLIHGQIVTLLPVIYAYNPVLTACTMLMGIGDGLRMVTMKPSDIIILHRIYHNPLQNAF